MIPNDFIQSLLNRIDIVDVVERSVPLKKAGANYVACCPFHSEKTPSFTVSQSKQFYHCFGCGVHGTAIGFVMQYQGLGFVEAVQELAGKAGIPIPMAVDNYKPKEERENLQDIMMQATNYYRQQLKQSPDAIAYLKNRGLSGETAARFGIGYAPSGWQNLQSVFSDYNNKVLQDVGLVIQGENGKRYDRFRERIMFPILDQRGQVIGFGGRVIGPGEPKYLNSPETVLFEKGRELYGLFLARRTIAKTGKVIVVEGYMDVVALVQYGVEYAVATLGTATTAMHIQKLFRHAEQIIFCFDGDEAGRRAAWRALENSLPHLVDGKAISFLLLPNGEDPDSFVRKSGKDGFEALLKDAVPLSAFLIRELVSRVDIETQEGRAKFLQDAEPMVKQIKATKFSLMLRKRLAELSGISQSELDKEYKIKFLPQQKTQGTANKNLPSIYRVILQCLISNPELVNLCEFQPPEKPGIEISMLTALLGFLRKYPEEIKTAGVIEFFSGAEYERFLSPLLAQIDDWVKKEFDVKAELTDCLNKLRLEEQKRSRTDLLSHSNIKNLSQEELTAVRQLSPSLPAVAEK